MKKNGYNTSLVSKRPSLSIFYLMKCNVFLLILLCFQINAKAYSQNNITLRVTNASIKKVVVAIEKKGDYRFMYNEALLKNQPTVSLDVTDQPIEKVLNQLLQKSDIDYKIMSNNLVILRSKEAGLNIVSANQVTVSGTVLNAGGTPLAGVTVSEKGTTNATSTSASGAYSITVADGATLVFSYVGYTTVEERVNGRTNISVVINQANNSLDEIVVVGYGTQKKSDLTGSITSVKGEEVAKLPGTNPIGSLQGKVAGLTIANSGRAGAAPVVRIRGINSTNSASPVYVVDGILVDDISFLNPNDIESIDVLRDPSSIAIYGLRGANGVIAVTSKKAAKGKTRVTLSSTVGVQKVNDLISVTDAAGFRKLYDQQLANIAGSTPFDYTRYTGNTNWQDEILRSALMTTNNIGIASSGEKSTTYFNIGYTNQDGVVGNDNFERYIVRLNNEIKVNNRIKVGGSFTGYHSINTPQGVNITNALWAAPIIPVRFADDIYYSTPDFQRAQVFNPVGNMERQRGVNIDKSYRIIGSVFAEFKFLTNFTFRSTLYGDLDFGAARSYNPLPFKTRDLGQYTQRDSTISQFNTTPSVSQNQNESKRFQQDHVLNFDKIYNGSHSVGVTAGFTTVYNQSSFINGTRRDTSVNIPNDPNYFYINIANLNNPGGFGGGGGNSSIAGAFGRVSYGFEGKYLLNATVRRDGSSKFASENRWGTFGSIGAGWVVSKENFFDKVKSIDFLKIRGAYGVTGNSNGIPDNIYQPGIDNSSSAVFGNNVYTSIQAAYLVDSTLKFESVRGLDIGFDARFLKNRLNLEVTYYNRTSDDILTSTEVVNDNRRLFTNLGEIVNKGIEVAMGWQDKIGSDFSYGVNANFSYNENKVKSIGDKINFALIGNGGANKTELGRSIGYFYGYRQTGIYQSSADLAKQAAFPNSLPGDVSYEDTDGDGVITPNDRQNLGTPFPVYNFGSNFTFGYKGFDAQIELQGVAGNKIYTQRRASNFALLNYETNRLNAWTAPGTSNIEPILDNRRGNNYLFSSYYLEPGDYLRLRTVQLGYTMKNNFTDKIGMQNARFYISGQNVKNWSKVTGYSPEAQIGSILGGGADNGAYPVPAIYTFGFNLTF